MKITKGEIKLLTGTVAIVAVVLLSGTWVSLRKAEVRNTQKVSAKGQGNKSTGKRYQLVYDIDRDGLLFTRSVPLFCSDVELKPNGQWNAYQGFRLRRSGTYEIRGKKIIFQGSPVGNPVIRMHTARLTEDGFAMTSNPFLGFKTPPKNLRYVRVR